MGCPLHIEKYLKENWLKRNQFYSPSSSFLDVLGKGKYFEEQIE
jgi:hypothetical protein